MDELALKETQKNINVQFLTPWPIVIILEALGHKIDLHHRKCTVLNDLFKTLLHKLMTGEIRVATFDLSTLAGTDENMDPNEAYA